MNSITKMDKNWIATATLIYPNTLDTYLVSESQIIEKIDEMFKTEITPIMLEKHLVSFIDRMADKNNLIRGGSRNRYLFRTSDGKNPNSKGNFRLYKNRDQQYDGWDKTGKECPLKKDVDEKYHYLLNWYSQEYVNLDSK